MTSPELLSTFTPSLLSADTLETIFVGRDDEAHRIEDSVRRSVATKGRHHSLLVGPRGIGKTHLVSLLYHRLTSDPDLAGKLRIAWLREDSWQVGSFADLLESIVEALTLEYEPVDLDAALDGLVGVDDETAEREAEAALGAWLGDDLLLVITENLDDVMASIGTDGQQKLRAFLQNHRNTVLLATSPGLFEEISEHASPFFGFFDVTQLDELSLDEARELLTRIAELRHDDELVQFLATDRCRRRLEVVQALAGGHPRIWVLLSECISTERLDELVPLFMKSLDDLTPYYQGRVRELPTQQRKIVSYLVRARGARPVKDIAAGCRIPEKSAAVQLAKLVRSGFVREAPEPSLPTKGDRRRTYYELREPLMRLCMEVKDSRGEPLRLIVEFLKCWYDRPLLAQRLSRLSRAQTSESKYLASAVGLTLVSEIGGRAETDRELAALKQRLEDKPSDELALSALALQLSLTEDHGGALDASRSAMHLAPENLVVLSAAGVVMFRCDGQPSELSRSLNLSRFEADAEAVAVACERPGHGILLVSSTALVAAFPTAEWPTAAETLLKKLSGKSGLTHLCRTVLTAAAAMFESDSSDDDVLAWAAAWQVAFEGDPYSRAFLPLLDAVIGWTTSGDRAVLLELPAEERKLFETLFGGPAQRAEA